ncbi:hypothetical protein PR202_ga05298 [Eleusine coracana subsp. coracana]|uniref:Uncharacterized protein n=1 Tax=Eleusine coracana subsp. coracana TaxID=191504 RepID=A0AAV5BST2_ELECO|nr:hypothetical protein PR202_ga04845 [Eleusine coracana subsp. coracana]GJM89146.1 hypothetical protein PR202_ga05298 [Eleusine coracana subsp. coracana]
MGFQVAAVAAPSPCARSSAATSSPSTSSRPSLGGGGGGGLSRSRSPINWASGVMVRRRPARATPPRCALSASLDGGMGAGDAEFLRRIEELAAAAGVGVAACGWPASVERRASSVGLPLSLRMLKRKKQQRWDERLLLVGCPAGESVGRAFSSMVLIVRELQSFALRQMRDALRCDDGVLARVQAEMHASFVWLFQHIFAGTPALMLALMLLLANFTVQSMGDSVAAAAAAATIPPPTPTAVEVLDTQQHGEPSRFDAGSVKTFSVGRTASVGGNSGGGGKARPVAGATGDGRSDESLYRLGRVAPDQSSAPAPGDADEQAVWEMMVSEASRMQAGARAEELRDPDVLGSLVAPVEAEMETEDFAEHALTRQRYELAVSEEPDNSLILSNFAQFLYLVQNDHDRAEHYFERAVRAEPADAEALSRYATFLWKARDDLAAAEDVYQEAIAADPGNSHHAAAYAHFLWNTGGEDTCYPLD